jgi:hypothetical protein
MSLIGIFALNNCIKFVSAPWAFTGRPDWGAAYTKR